METSVTYTDEIAYLSSDEKKTINRILKLTKDYSKEIDILAYPETNDGCIYCKLPAKWIKIQPPKKLELSDEERAARAARLQKHVINRQSKTNE